MEHGEERNRRIKRQYSEFNAVGANGEPIHIKYCCSEVTVAEKWCKHCGEFVSTEAMGIFGFAWCPQCHNTW